MRSMLMIGRTAGRPRGAAWSLTGGVLAICLLALAGCEDLQPATSFEPETDASKLFGSLTLDHRAINLSTQEPYNTIQLTATPRNLLGQPMEGLPAPTFRSSDTASVWVTPEGLVQARKVTNGVQVIAELVTGDNIRHADTAYVRVTTAVAPPELGSLEITFASPEEAEWPMTTGEMASLVSAYFMMAGLPSPSDRTLTAVARDGAGNPLTGIEIDYVSLDPQRVTIDRRTGQVEKVLGPPGDPITVIARTTAYGVTKADTATITVVGPTVHTFVVIGVAGYRSWLNTEVVIRPGGYVMWYYVTMTGNPLTIKFKDSTGGEPVAPLCDLLGMIMGDLFCYNGDMSFSGLTYEGRMRYFPTAGVYEFEGVEDGIEGRVRVVADDDPMWDAARNGRR